MHEDPRRKLLRNLMALRVKKGRSVDSDLLYGQHLHPGGRKFYGQWDNVQPSGQYGILRVILRIRTTIGSRLTLDSNI